MWFLFAAASGLSACAPMPTHNKLYEGPDLPRERVARIINYECLIGGVAQLSYIFSVDGKGICGSRWDGTSTIDVMPGTHEIVATLGGNIVVNEGPFKSVESVDSWKTPRKKLRFCAEAGHTYVVINEIGPVKGSRPTYISKTYTEKEISCDWDLWIIDKLDGTRVLTEKQHLPPADIGPGAPP